MASRDLRQIGQLGASSSKMGCLRQAVSAQKENGIWEKGYCLRPSMAVAMILMNTKDNKDLSKSRVLVAGGRRGRVLNPAPRQSVVDPEHRQPAGHWKSTFEFSI